MIRFNRIIREKVLAANAANWGEAPTPTTFVGANLKGSPYLFVESLLSDKQIGRKNKFLLILGLVRSLKIA